MRVCNLQVGVSASCPVTSGMMEWLVSGAGAAGRGVASSTDLHHRHVGDDRRAEHGRLERDSPQDEHHQRARSRLPGPQLPGQCHR